MNLNHFFSYWLQILCLLLALAILQMVILPAFLKSFFIPSLLWLPLYYFLLHKSFWESLSLLILVSLLSSVFLSLPFTLLFFVYFSGFLFFLILKEIFLFRSLPAVFILIFVFSLSFFFMIEKSVFLLNTSLSGYPLSVFSIDDTFVTGKQLLFYSSKSFLTSLSYLFFLFFFKKTT